MFESLFSFAYASYRPHHAVWCTREWGGKEIGSAVNSLIIATSKIKQRKCSWALCISNKIENNIICRMSIYNFIAIYHILFYFRAISNRHKPVELPAFRKNDTLFLDKFFNHCNFTGEARLNPLMHIALHCKVDSKLGSLLSKLSSFWLRSNLFRD